MAFDKKILCGVGAGLVAVICLGLSVSQCSQKNSERDEKEAAIASLDSIKRQMDEMNDRIDELAGENEDWAEIVSGKDTTISNQRNQIDDLNNSVAALQDSLDDCRKKLPCKECDEAKKKSGAKKAKKSKVRKNQNCKRQNNNSGSNTVVVPSVPVAPCVPAPCNPTPNNTVIVNGNNNGNIVINNGGAVANVNNNAAPEQTATRVLHSTCVSVKRISR